MEKEFIKLRDQIIESKYEGLNEQQREAVLTVNGPVLLLAGAGSGKTMALTNRIGHLIKYGDAYQSEYIPNDLQPSDIELMREYLNKNISYKRVDQLLEQQSVYGTKILAFTFTNKAAKEMQTRIEKIVGDEAYYMWIGTFHSICVKMLRRDADKIGFDSNFVIYDMLDQKTLLKEIIKELGYKTDAKEIRIIQSRISEAKNDMIWANEFEELNRNDIKMKKTIEVYSIYERKLKEYNAMDFDDLLLNAIKLLEQEDEILSYYQKKFEYVHVDEYQDTNRVQYRLIRLLSSGHGNICAVGDTDQSIYSWRGADIRNINDFEKDFKQAKIIKLEQNYRSTENILAAANEVIKNNVVRKEKNLWTNQKGGEKVRYYRGHNEYDEAEFVAREISKMKREGYQHSDMAILYRTNAQSRVFEEIFRANQIPHQIVGGLKFFDRKEIQDIMAYLKFVFNPKDTISLKRIINRPSRKIGKKTVEKVEAFASNYGLTLGEVILNSEIRGQLDKKLSKKVDKFYECIKRTVAVSTTEKAANLIEYILQDTGYLKDLKDEDSFESRSRIENLKELVSVAYNLEEKNGISDLQGFLENTCLQSDIDGYEEEKPKVALMTLHSAKGLEFPIVFVVGLEEGLFPSGRSLDDVYQLEEERRLCYVGITRGEKVVYLTHATSRTQYGKTKANLVSRFIEEIPTELIHSYSPTIAKRERRNISFGSSPSFQKPIKKKTVDFDLEQIHPGTKVEHATFGLGTVINKNSKNIATIAFDGQGIKKLSLDLAPIEILQ